MQRAKIEEQRRSVRVKQEEKVMSEEETGIKFELLGEEGVRNDGRMSAPSLRQFGLHSRVRRGLLASRFP